MGEGARRGGARPRTSSHARRHSNATQTFDRQRALLEARTRCGPSWSMHPLCLKRVVARASCTQPGLLAALEEARDVHAAKAATRLRLRTALIPDFELRQKLEADIDSMTGIIESVLTYTRAEMNVEAPRKLSLGSLIDSIVADYQDMGKDVTFREGSDIIVQGARSVFTSRQGQSVFAPDRDVTVMGRPISLERAVANLIENALKYGRRATVALEADAQTATIVIEDEGSESSAADMEALMAPFQRGTNTATIDGYGLGLTIVAAIAKLHGGSLSFKDTPVGLSACLLIDRG